MIAALLTLLIFFGRWAPQSWLGSALHKAVRKIIVRLGTVRPSTVLSFIVVCSAMATLIVFGQFDGMLIAALAAPETLAMFLLVDVGTAVEIMVAAWFAASQVNIGRASTYIRRIYVVFRGALALARPRPRQPRRTRSPIYHTDDGESSLAGRDFARA